METTPYARGSGIHCVHAILLAFPIALFSAALITDIAYLRTEELQWTNFSAWLITGGLAFTGLVLAWAAIALAVGFKAGEKLRRAVYAALLMALFVIGFINALQHSRDGWSSVGTLGLVLSIISAVLAIAAGVVAHTRFFSREIDR